MDGINEVIDTLQNITVRIQSRLVSIPVIGELVCPMENTTLQIFSFDECPLVVHCGVVVKGLHSKNFQSFPLCNPGVG